MSLQPQQRVYTCFFLFAVSLGTLLSRLPDIQDALAINKAELGLTLIGNAIGALASLTLSASMVARLGARKTALITVLGIAGLLALVPWATSAIIVFSLLFGVGLLAGALEINLNVEVDRIEHQLGRSVMHRAHGFWSFGFFLTAAISSVVRQAEISPELHIGVTFVFVVAVGSMVITGIRDAPSRTENFEGDTPHFSWPTLAVAPLCIIGIAASLLEGAGIDWSAIYMRDVFRAEPGVGGLALTVFTGFMTLARLISDSIIDRYGARAVALSMLIVSIFGVSSVWFATNQYVALFGFALMGLGCSVIYPMAMSAAAQLVDRPAHLNVAAVGQMAFVALFLAPPLLGFIAEHAGIRTAYLVCLPVTLAAVPCIKFLKPRLRTA